MLDDTDLDFISFIIGANQARIRYRILANTISCPADPSSDPMTRIGRGMKRVREYHDDRRKTELASSRSID